MKADTVIRGFVEIEHLDPITGQVLHVESGGDFDAQNMIVNYAREMLPLLLAPKIISGRGNNSPSSTTWLDRRVCLIGFGIGDGGSPNPTVKPEEPEDGRSKLIGESAYPNSKQGLQQPIRRVPTVPGEPSGAHSGASPINSYYLFKEVDADGVTITQFEGGGAEIKFQFTVEEDEYIGNIMEYGLYLGGGDAGDDSTYEVDVGEPERRRLSRESATMLARKTRNSKFEKVSGYKFRFNWRIRT